jgi:hypothetical protein
VLWAAQKRAGLRRIKWHELRHSFASILASGGTPQQSTERRTRICFRRRGRLRRLRLRALLKAAPHWPRHRP